MTLRNALFLLVFVSISASGYAQWKIVAPNAVHSATPWEGEAIHYKDGVIWAADTDLVISRDTGKTWTRVVLPQFASRVVTDISFLNRDTGVLGNTYGFIFQTFDGGTTWNEVFNTFDLTFNFGFVGKLFYKDSAHIYSMFLQDGLIYSTNGGNSWTVRPIPVPNGNALGLTVSQNGTIYTEDGSLNNVPRGKLSGNILSSTDLGVTWQTISPPIDGDCYSVEIDPFDSTRIYVVDENYALPGDSISKILVGSTKDNVWNATFSHQRLYLSGGMTLSQHAVYVTTVTEGILRSTDRGVTWQRIGGPNTTGDTRSICSVNDNILFAMDTMGNIWETTNSGGDSVVSKQNFLSIAPSIIFDGDTLACNDLSQVVRFYRQGPSPPSVTGWTLIGSDSGNYSASNFTQDSIVISLHALHHGLQSASIVFSISDGTSDTIHLAGFVAPLPSPFTFSTIDVKTDTIGAEVFVPVLLSGIQKPEDILLSLHYDGDVRYLGSFDSAGNQLDLPGSANSGYARLHIPNDTPGHTAAWAKFLVFADSSTKPTVTFDSLVVAGAGTPCEFLAAPSAMSTISPPEQCGSRTLSRSIQGEPWNFIIRPNPTHGAIEITTSLAFDDASLEVFDALGTKWLSASITISAQNPFECSLAVPAGLYEVRIHSSYGVRSTRVMVVK